MNRGVVLAALLVAACSSRSQENVQATKESAIVTEVEARVRSYAQVFGPALCENPDPFYDFWTYDHGGVVLVERGKVSALDAETHRAYNKEWFCSVAVQTSQVPTVIVQVLDDNNAVSTWTFQEETTTKDGVTERVRGEVMQPWVRKGGTWRSTGLVATHEPIPGK